MEEIKNVFLRGGVYYINVPFNALKQRRRVATHLKVTALPVGVNPEIVGVVPALIDEDPAKVAAYVLLCRFETLVNGLTPRWDLVQAFHDGELTLKDIDHAFVTHGGIASLNTLLDARRLDAQASKCLETLVAEWPAMPLHTADSPSETTIRNRRSRLERLAKELQTLGALTSKNIQKFLTTAHGSRRQPASTRGANANRAHKVETQRTYRRDIQMFCVWLVSTGYLKKNPAQSADIKLPRSKPKKIRFVEFDVLMKIHETLPSGPARDAFGFMVATGSEPGPINQITASCVNVQKQLVHVDGTKNCARSREVYVEKWFWPRILELVAQAGRVQPLMPIDRQRVAKQVHKAVQQLLSTDKSLSRLEGFRPYDARHSWAVRWLKENQADPQQVATQLGHVNVRMVTTLYGRWISNSSALRALDRSRAVDNGEVKVQSQSKVHKETEGGAPQPPSRPVKSSNHNALDLPLT